MQEIKISVYHIIHFTELIDKTFTTYEKLLAKDVFKDNNNSDLRVIVYMNTCSQILLYTNFLRKEYFDFFTITNTKNEEEKEKIRQINELLKPVFKKIDEWKDIKNFRDNVLAHNLRDKKKGRKSVFMLKGLSGYNIPEKPIEYLFLIRCTNIIKKVIYEVFEKEYIEIDEEINSDKYNNKALMPRRDYDKEYDYLVKELKTIQKKIEERFS